MVIVYSTNSGYSLIQMLISLCIISSLSLLFLNINHNLVLKHYSFISDYLYTQSSIILNKKEEVYEKGIRFNSMGHVNQGRTIDFNSHKVIVHLSNGYVTYE